MNRKHKSKFSTITDKIGVSPQAVVLLEYVQKYQGSKRSQLNHSTTETITNLLKRKKARNSSFF